MKKIAFFCSWLCSSSQGVTEYVDVNGTFADYQVLDTRDAIASLQSTVNITDGQSQHVAYLRFNRTVNPGNLHRLHMLMWFDAAVPPSEYIIFSPHNDALQNIPAASAAECLWHDLQANPVVLDDSQNAIPVSHSLKVRLKLPWGQIVQFTGNIIHSIQIGDVTVLSVLAI